MTRTRRERAPPPNSKCHEITKRQATGRLSCRRVAACPLQILLCARGRPAPVRAVTSATNNAMWAGQLGLTHPPPKPAGPESSRVTQQHGTAARVSRERAMRYRPGKRRRCALTRGDGVYVVSVVVQRGRALPCARRLLLEIK